MNITHQSVSAVLLAFALTLPAAQAASASSKQPAASAELNMEMANREANKKTVLAFYDAIVKLDFEAARQYVGDYYIEHDPEREDGLPGLEKALNYARRTNARQNVAHELVVADGELVAVYSKSTSIVGPPPGRAPGGGPPASGPPPSGAPNAGPPSAAPAPQPNLVADIFRVQNGKIVEHWNAIYTP